MPLLTAPLTAVGALIQVTVGVSAPKGQLLAARSQAVPMPMIVSAMLDTGASCSAVDPEVINRLDLQWTGEVDVSTISTGVASERRDQYEAMIALHMDSSQAFSPSYTIPAMPVVAAPLAHEGFLVLIGRDILSRGPFVYNGKSGQLVLAF